MLISLSEREIGRWRDGTGSLAARLAAALREAISAGRIAAGQRLPPERALAGALGVSRTTVVSAYDALRAEGWLASRRGSGTFVSAAAWGGPAPQPWANAIFTTMISSPGRLIDLSLASPGADPTVADAARAAAQDLGRFTTTPGYFPAGLPSLRGAIARYLDGWGLPSKPEDVLITTGCQQALALVFAELLQPGETALVESPTFPGALDALRAARARLVSVSVGTDGVLPGAVHQLLTRTQARLVYVTPTFNNPTGAVQPIETRQRLARLAAEFQVPLIEDHSLADLAFGDPPPPPVGSNPAGGTVVTVGSLSKLFWGGLRVGWVRAPRHLIERLTQRKVVADISSPVLDQLAAVHLLRRLEEVRRRRCDEMRARREQLAELLGELLPDWSWRLPQGGVCLWVRLPTGDAREFAGVALRHGVIAVAGPQFAPGEAWIDHMRLPITASPDHLSEGVARLSKAWREYVPTAAWPAAQQRAVV